jgi:CPA1 family monovalent cation:H+ antiporter
VIVVRFIWVFAATYLPRYFSKKLRKRDPYPSWRSVAIVAWTGMRGVVSLAAALALPSMLPEKFSQTRDATVNLIIFFTYVVILVTLVFQGLTLPALIRWLKVTSTGETDREEREARLKANLAAMARLAELEERNRYPEELLRRLRTEYEDRIRQLEMFDENQGENRSKLFSKEFEHLEQEALDIERRTIIKLRNERVINDVAMRRIQRDLDLAEARLRGRD